MTSQVIRTFFSAALFLLIPLPAAMADYYVYDGHSLSFIRGNPDYGSYDLWAVFYFQRGDPATNPATSWGEDVASTVDKIRMNVLRSQKIEKNAEKWCGCDWGAYTFFNPVYPVAITKRPNPPDDQVWAVFAMATGIENIVSKILALADRFNQAADLAGESRPIPQVSQGPVVNFVRAMQKSFHQAFQFKRDFGNIADVGMENIKSQFAALNSGVSFASQLLDPAIQTMRSGASGDQASSRPSSSSSGLVLPAPWGPGIFDQTARVQGNFLIIDRGGGALGRYYAIPLSNELISIPDSEPFGDPRWELVFQCRKSDPCIKGGGSQAEIYFPSKEAGVRFLNSWNQTVR